MNNTGDFYLADAIDVIEEILASGGEFRMYPRGTSMLPLIVQGEDSVVLKRNTEIPARKHDIAFYRRPSGQFVLHRVMKIDKDGTYVMCGDNQYVLEKAVKKEAVIGYVSEIYKGDKPVGLRSLKYRAYVFFWSKIPIRRLVRLPRRVYSKLLRIKKKHDK